MTPGADRHRIEVRLDAIAIDIALLTKTRASTITHSWREVDWTAFLRSMPKDVIANYTTREGRLMVAKNWWKHTPVDVRRSVLRDTFTIEVARGHRGPQRVIITPRSYGRSDGQSSDDAGRSANLT